VLVRRIFAVLLFVVGAIWILQGVDILGGSSMTGNGIWAVIGTILIIIGVVLLRAPRSRSGVEPPER
jgi:membrane-bound ClpP family serine protease